MKRLTIMALLALVLVVLVACAPVVPTPDNGKKTDDKSTDDKPTDDKPVDKNETTEQNETIEPEKNETIDLVVPDTPVDLRDVPKKDVLEGDLVNFPNLRAVDPDGDPIEYTFSSPLNEEGEWQTEEGDAGEHLVTITASDGSHTVSQQILIVVESKNKAPIIQLAQPINTKEGETIIISPNITDADGDQLNITYTGWFTNTTREVGYDDQGLHKFVISATDGYATTTREFVISVENTNRAPEIESIPAQTIKEGQTVIVKPRATDIDDDFLSFTYDFPLDEEGVWESEVGDAGEYEVLVTVTDGELTAEELFILVVEEINQPPVIELEGPILTEEGQIVNLEPIVTDKEGDEVEVTYSGWMTSNTKYLSYEDAGNHRVVITATDSAGNEASIEVIVMVDDLNRAPIFGAGSFT